MSHPSRIPLVLNVHSARLTGKYAGENRAGTGRDSTENCLTGKRAQELGLEYAKANFPGHQALVCTHMDGHNGSGNIHVHIVINSL